LLIWNLKSGMVLHRVPFHADSTKVQALALVSGGEFLLSAAWFENSLKLWNLRNGVFIEEFHFDQHVEAIACASNGMICVGLGGGRVCFLRFNNLSSHSGLQH
jgi:WD40 repeat protein